MSPIESTLKHRDVEETIDLYFYRPLGYGLSRLLALTPVTPNAVTVASMVVGVAGGHLLYYPGLAPSLLGMALIVAASLLDSADGQLARLKGSSSRIGRLLDGWADGLVFASIYLHLGLRLAREGFGGWVLVLAVLAGLSQALQNQMADYYRNAFLALAVPGGKDELDSVADAREMRAAAGASGGALERALLGFYVGYTARQERLSPAVARLARVHARLDAGDEQREHLRERYAALVRPLIRHLGWIATNFRTIALFILVPLGLGAWFLWLTVTGFNLALVAIVLGHERRARAILAEIGG